MQTLTHELKTPLAAITGAAELLRQPMDDDSRRRFLTNIDNETQRLHQMGERLLLLAQVEQQPELHNHDDIVVAEMVKEVLASRTDLAGQRNVRFESSVADGLIVRGDRLLLSGALANLVDNAMDFTPEGGEIRLSGQAANGGIELGVQNSGEPVPDWALQRVGERFYSLPRPRTGRKSTGLGLTFVQEVAALHRGRFQLENVENGVRATLWLPAPTR